MASSLASTSSSSFASLLRQSKFASYSPAIAQVYETYGGHAARGDWGVKRPLSIRKRNKGLMIQSIDSPYQQTEFRSGEPEAKMVERWEETGVDVEPSSKTTQMAFWGSQYTNRPSSSMDVPIDSEFSSYGSGDPLGIKTPPSTEARPNTSLMTKKEFERYLTKIRQYRPEFREFVKLSSANPWSQAVDNAEKSTQEKQLFRMRTKVPYGNQADQFLERMTYELHGSSTSQALEPYPHRNGGLVYHRPSSFQTSLLYSHIPSRITSKSKNNNGPFIVSSAGVSVAVQQSESEGRVHLDWERKNTSLGIVPLRINVAQLYRPPEVVATFRSDSLKPSTSAPAAHTLRKRNPDLTSPPFTYPAGINGMGLVAEGVVVRNQEPRTNAFRPGSINYSAHEVPKLKYQSTAHKAKRPPGLPVGLDAALAPSPGVKNRVERRTSEDVTSMLDGLLNKV